ncbi:geranylgeranyl pyrophosphate synthetase, partial [Tulasnella sp. 427]
DGGIPPKVELDRMVTEELMNLHRGQGLDLFWRDTLTCPTEEQYIAMVSNKTGGLFRLAIKLMMAKSTSDVDYVPLVNLIGVYFQIRDDYMNLQSTEYTDNKGYCEDLTEGKFSFPIVHSVRADTSNRQILNVLSKRPSTPTMKRYAVNYMRDHTQSFEYSRKVLDKLDKQARAEVERLGGNPKLEAILDALQVKDGKADES